MRKHLRRPSPALVIALIALFVAMGGSGYAAVKLNGKNLKNKSIAGSKLKNKTITGGKLKNNTLGGTQVNESKLGKVPSAAKADTATSATTAGSAGSAGNSNTVAGHTIRKFNFRTSSTTGATEILNVGGLRLTASCTVINTGFPLFLTFRVLDVVASTTQANADLVSISQNLFADGEVEGTDDGNGTNDDLEASDENINDINLIGGFGAGGGNTNDVSLLPDFPNGPGTTHFRTAGNGIVTVHWTGTDGIFLPCVFNGNAVSG